MNTVENKQESICIHTAVPFVSEGIITLILKLLNKYLLSTMKNAVLHKAILLREFSGTTASSNITKA